LESDKTVKNESGEKADHDRCPSCGRKVHHYDVPGAYFTVCPVCFYIDCEVLDSENQEHLQKPENLCQDREMIHDWHIHHKILSKFPDYTPVRIFQKPFDGQCPICMSTHVEFWEIGNGTYEEACSKCKVHWNVDIGSTKRPEEEHYDNYTLREWRLNRYHLSHYLDIGPAFTRDMTLVELRKRVRAFHSGDDEDELDDDDEEQEEED